MVRLAHCADVGLGVMSWKARGEQMSSALPSPADAVEAAALRQRCARNGLMQRSKRSALG